MKREELYLQKNYLKEIITNDFRYIGEIRSIKPINHNDINSKNFLVECKKSKYVLKFLRNHQKRLFLMIIESLLTVVQCLGHSLKN